MAATMSVQVRKCQLRDKPSFLAKTITSLAYADQVTIQQEKDDWYRVVPLNRPNGGWVHVSALSKKKIVLKPGSRDIDSAASSDELALAGKGFNEQVEKDFKKKNKNVDFTWVDKMEKIVISQVEMQNFLKDGGLIAEGEGA
ncbi:MAG: SH3 domain-containing protein [Desulfobulbaceae bacterium]|nr:SH3 domain-containing protein [Desulfobulbaceae bacterium]